MRRSLFAIAWSLGPAIAYVALLRLTAPQGVDPSGRATLFGLQLMIWVCFGVPLLIAAFTVMAAKGVLPGTRLPAEAREDVEADP